MTARVWTGLVGAAAGALIAAAIVAGTRGCAGEPEPRVATDLLEIDGDTGGDVVAFIDGRLEDGCVHDLIVRGRGMLTLGNLLAPQGCHSELTIFQVDRGMYNTKLQKDWSDDVGERISVSLTKPLESVDVVVRMTDEMNERDEARAINDLARANHIFNTMRCGIRFHLVGKIERVKATNVKTCQSAYEVNEQIGAKTGVVNIYYTPKMDPLPGKYLPPRGAFCKDSAATVLVTRDGDNEVLAHELGHALSLDHGGSTHNVMNDGTILRRSLAEGQCFRCNTDTNSFLNWRGRQRDPRQSCTVASSNSNCPPYDRMSRVM